MTFEFLLCVGVLFLLAGIGAPIAYAILVAVLVYLFATGQGLGVAGKILMDGLYQSFILLAVPLFIVAANIMNAGTISDRLLSFCVALVGRFRGGLGHVNVVASLIFSGMSGSAVADAAGIGKIIIGMMTKSGHYTRGYAAAITAASATIGPIIPPSIPMVLYALVSNTSIGYLFLGGIVPGLFMGAVLMGMNWYLSKRRGFAFEEPVPLSELPRRTARAFPALLMPAILLYGIYGGVTTPTEAAAVAAFYALVLAGVFYRALSLGALYHILVESARSSAAIGLVIGGALILNYVVASENIPGVLAAHLVGSGRRSAGVPAGGQPAVPAARLRSGRDHDHPGDHPAVHSGLSRIGDRSRAFRRRVGGELHDRADHAALRHPAVRDHRRDPDPALGDHPRGLAVSGRAAAGAARHDPVAGSDPDPAADVRLRRLNRRPQPAARAPSRAS